MEAGKVPEEGTGRQAATMRSPVNWALLGLIIERPSYAYDLAQRFERRYGEALTLSNIGHVYTALGALGDRSMIEEIPGTRTGRQPKPHYRVTACGLQAYKTWLIGHVDEDRRRNQLFVRALAALTNEPEQLVDVMAGYEQTLLREGMSTAIPGKESAVADNASALLDRLSEEENRLAVGAKLEWVEYARGELNKLNGRVRGR